MASNLRVDQITASTAGSVSIGTATFTGGLSGSITGLNVTGVITATTLNQNVSGILTAQNGIRVTGDRVGINSVNATEPTAPLEIRSASTVQTNTGHIVLSGDGATVGEGPQIMFNESGSGSSFAGAYIGHIRQGSNSVGDLVFGTRESAGDLTTVPTERVRITSTGNVGIGTDNPVNSNGYSTLTIAKNTGGQILLRSSANNKDHYIWGEGSLNVGADYGGTGGSLVIKVNGNNERARITSTGNVQIANGNLVFSTSGTGIDFSATSQAAGMTSELLSDYEEGTFTPTWQGTTVSGTWAAAGRYVKIGRQVTVEVKQTSGSVSWNAQSYIIGGLPFNPSTGTTGAAGTLINNSPNVATGALAWSSARIYAVGAASNQNGVLVSITYQTDD